MRETDPLPAGPNPPAERRIGLGLGQEPQTVVGGLAGARAHGARSMWPERIRASRPATAALPPPSSGERGLDRLAARVPKEVQIEESHFPRLRVHLLGAHPILRKNSTAFARRSATLSYEGP